MLFDQVQGFYQLCEFFIRDSSAEPLFQLLIVNKVRNPPFNVIKPFVYFVKRIVQRFLFFKFFLKFLKLDVVQFLSDFLLNFLTSDKISDARLQFLFKVE